MLAGHQSSTAPPLHLHVSVSVQNVDTSLPRLDSDILTIGSLLYQSEYGHGKSVHFDGIILFQTLSNKTLK